MRALLLWALALGLCTTALVVTGSHALAARERARETSQELSSVAEQLREVVSLRVSSPRLPPLPKGAGTLSPRINAALRSCGLPAATLANLAPEADHELPVREGAQRLVRRRVSLSLSHVSLQTFGAFLKAWRDAEPDWTITSIDITPTIPKEGAPGGDLPLNIRIAMEAHFAAETPAAIPGGAR